MSFTITDQLIGDPRKCFVIAEIGQNHQGDIEIAKRMILSAKECGADCVKFQKSSLEDKFTKSALSRLYVHPNAWAPTYGEHKKHLEFSIEQYQILQDYANSIGIAFTASAMDIVSFRQLVELNVPFIKIGSGDANNFPLLEYAASNAQMPLIISTGMQTEQTVRQIVKIMLDRNKLNFSLLHCVSSYPTMPEDCNLRTLELYRKWFPNICIGYSGHEKGLAISTAAVLLGARIIERHFTLDKNQKGTDHQLSLDPNELRTLVSTIRHINHKYSLVESFKSNEIISILKMENYFAFNEKDIEACLKNFDKKDILPCERDCDGKLGKSLVYSGDLKVGHILVAGNIGVKVSDPKGIRAENYYQMLGRQLRKDVMYDMALVEDHF